VVTTTTIKKAAASPVAIRSQQTPRTELVGLSGRPADQRAGELIVDLTLIAGVTGLIATAVNVRRRRQRRTR
jgi:hypothetical protein